MEILSMNVVVSAIVDPWVTTLSFVVALAMKIQVRIFHELPYLSVVFGRIDILREFIIHSLSGNFTSFMNCISSQ